MASVLALGTIKSNVKALFDANLTALSNGLSTSVAKVLTINPERIPIQASFFPCICIFFEGKTIELKDMSGNQDQGRRQAELDLRVVGIVYNDNFNTDADDPADTEIEKLMENIEKLLRESDTTFSNTVLFSYPTEVDYFSFSLDEETHFRGGMMTIKARAHY